MAKKIKVQVIMGSIREGRRGEVIMNWFYNIIKKVKEFDAELVDLKEWNLPMFSEPISPGAANGKYARKEVQKWADKIAEGDAYVMITPEYNHGYPASLKNALDHLSVEWKKKPVAFISYGGSAGGARSMEQLRQVAIELDMVPIKELITFPYFWSAFDEKGNPKDEMYGKMADSMINSLLWWAKVLKKAREDIKK